MFRRFVKLIVKIEESEEFVLAGVAVGNQRGKIEDLGIRDQRSDPVAATLIRPPECNDLHLMLGDTAFPTIAELGATGDYVIDPGRECRLGGDEGAEFPGFFDRTHTSE